MIAILFILFAGLAVGCAVAMVAQRNPLYSAISLIGVFISLAALYLMLAAPFIAAVQVIVYAGAIMVLVVFVIMLLNVEEEVRRRIRLPVLIPSAILLAAVLIAQAAFVIYFVHTNAPTPGPQDPTTSNVGLTSSIGRGLFTTYLLPFEITSVLLLMAIVGAMTLARRAALAPDALPVPGSAVLTKSIIDPDAVGDATPVIARTSEEAEELLTSRDE
ncbi:MAG TPA: NADH-quinone oxidoreductase subunit J [Pyrinomonadaceae bacterium]|nr:NADH-quinone oxidoreductase subunit J [Pyrinomonadaceae bacterium]